MHKLISKKNFVLFIKRNNKKVRIMNQPNNMHELVSFSVYQYIVEKYESTINQHSAEKEPRQIALLVC